MVGDLDKALDALSAEGCKMGSGWEIAHEVAQANEGVAIFEQLHALCHRIEGDIANAHYWYRRAGVEMPSGDFDEELKNLMVESKKLNDNTSH